MISVTILAKDSARTLAPVLASLEGFDEVIVADTGSKDDTRLIASTFKNVRLIEVPFEGFGKTHNVVSHFAKHDWILSIDSDEVVPLALKEEILALNLQPKTVYSVARKNFYRGTWIWSSGWWPDRVGRLYNKAETSFSDRAVHEAVMTSGMQIVSLKEPLHHTPFLSVSDFLQKLDRYSTLASHGKKGWPIWHGFAAFFKSYIIKRGVFQGELGFEISLYNGLSSYYKYLKRRDN